MRIDLPDDIKAARIFLADWGVWHKMTHNLPAFARLVTPREGIRSDNNSLDLSHRAVMAVRADNYDHFDVIRFLYENPSMSAKSVFEKVGAGMGISTCNAFNKLRLRAERAFYRHREALSLDIVSEP